MIDPTPMNAPPCVRPARLAGRPYAWPEEELADLDIDSLPAIDAEMAAAFLDEALALIPAELRPKSLARDRQPGPAISAHTQAGTLPAIRAALAWLPNAELDYDSWMRIGLALKGALGEKGAAVFADWSAQAAKNDPATTAKAWESSGPTGSGRVRSITLRWRKGGDRSPVFCSTAAFPTTRHTRPRHCCPGSGHYDEGESDASFTHPLSSIERSFRAGR